MAAKKSRKNTRSLGGKVLNVLMGLFLSGTLALGVGGYVLYRSLEADLPDIEMLRSVRYHVPLRIYSREGLLMARYGEEKSSPIVIGEVPADIKNAFLSAEDNRFFDHPGVDYQGLLRATFSFLRTGEKRQGGSTITMQVARNFFLSSEKTMLRKVREILLAIKIESRLTKEEILELYLNKIYFGHHAYGIVAAAQVYYGKTATELSLPEIAMIAGLPKAPSSFNPLANPERALIRRNYVLSRMQKLGYLDEARYQEAVASPVTTHLHTLPIELNAPYAAEMARNELYQQYGEEAYTNGYRVYTTIDARLQKAAVSAVQTGLHSYDERHGYRGSRQRIDLTKMKSRQEWDIYLEDLTPVGLTLPALVTAVKDRSADVYLGHGKTLELGWNGMRWARKYLNENGAGPQPRTAREVMKPGDIIRIRQDADKTAWLSQIPETEAALVALDPKNGAIQALVGGYDSGEAGFNRAIQAERQPGSGFKPILYAAALMDGFSPASVINDAPIVIADPSQPGGVWRPQNYSGQFYGPTTLRDALTHSRNLVSIRLLRTIGLSKARDMAIRFGFKPEELPNSLTLALGSGSATPLRMAEAYSVFANGGFKVEPYLIDRIETDTGAVVYRATPDTATENPTLTPKVHYMMNSMLQDVIRKGTATRALELKRSDLAGKTGTTNENRDAWFNGYAPSLVAVTWMGKDSSKPLGGDETGGHAALPLWINFMREALKGVPEYNFPMPTDLSTDSMNMPGEGESSDSGVGPDGQDDELNRGSDAPTGLPGQPLPGSLDKPIESLF